MISLTINVSYLSTVLANFTDIQVQRADDYAFTINTSVIATIPLTSSEIYYYNDVAGTSSNWYRSRYYNSGTFDTSEWSSPVRGEEIDYFVGATYPVEQSYSTDDWTIINKVRFYLGDLKKVSREYASNCYENLMGDYYTYDLPSKGWPLRVSLTTPSGSSEFVTLSNPIIQGYKYVVFSGAQNRITQGSVIDIWYSTFMFSDKEIKSNYDLAALPPLASLTTSTDEDILSIITAINLCEAELQEFVIEASNRVRDGDTEYDPTPGVRARELRLNQLRKKLDDILKSVTDMSKIEGVLID